MAEKQLNTQAWQVLAAAVAAPRKRPGLGDDVVGHKVVQTAAAMWLIAVCADGAGSARLGRRGAEVAVRQALLWLQTKVQRKRAGQTPWMVSGLQRSVDRALQAEAQRQKTSVRELATTLVCAVAGPTRTWLAQVGDGAAVVQMAVNSAWLLPIWPDRGEHVNETLFAGDPRSRWHSQELPPVQALAVLSDGLLPVAVDHATRQPFQPFFSGLAGELRRGEAAQLHDAFVEFLSSPRLAERTDDDVSLVLAVRRAEAGGDVPA
jgi:hypothetical protein